jgi:hypothetical protein
VRFLRIAALALFPYLVSTAEPPEWNGNSEYLEHRELRDVQERCTGEMMTESSENSDPHPGPCLPSAETSLSSLSKEPDDPPQQTL